MVDASVMKNGIISLSTACKNTVTKVTCICDISVQQKLIRILKVILGKIKL